MWTLPNLMTFARIVLVGPVLYLYLQERYALSLALLILTLLLDFFDGWVARRFDQCSSLGAILDPVADKWVSLTCFGFIGWQGLVWPWFVWLVYARAIAQLLSIPILSWWLKRSFHVRPRWPAKWATGLLFLLIPLHLFSGAFGLTWLVTATKVIVVGSACLELYILVTYAPRLWQIARGTHDTFE